MSDRFGAIDWQPDPGALIAMQDALKLTRRPATDVLRERLPVGRARTVLDVGCGTGGDVMELARRMRAGGLATGVDASETMIGEARRRAGVQRVGAAVAFRTGNALNLPFPSDAFDVCRSEAMLGHTPDPRRAVWEMARVTRPGGRVGAAEYDQGGRLIDHPDRAATRAVVDALSESVAQPWIGRELTRVFRETGLVDLTIDPVLVLMTFDSYAGILSPAVDQVVAEGTLSVDRAEAWWGWLRSAAEAGTFVAAIAIFVVTGTKP
jgi:ubiquinone/menaquinone biosynthesis C-methylase UbiE